MYSKPLAHSNAPKVLLQYLKPESNGVKPSFRSWKKPPIMLIFVRTTYENYMMKYGAVAFWGLFIAYFILVHPCILYYNSYHTSNNTPDGMLALAFLMLSILLWSVVLGFLLWLILKNGILAQRNLNYIEQHGKRLDGLIRESKVLREHGSGPALREIILEMTNFSGHRILHTMTITDSKPEENRFTPGRSISLRVDPSFSRNPYVFLEGSHSKVNYMLFLPWFMILTGVILYYRYAYASESGSLGWRFLELSHPLIVIPASSIFAAGILYFIIRVFIMGKKTTAERLKLKFLGEVTIADIVEVTQTGTYINNQPQVQYTLEFRDKKGTLIRAGKKQIVSLMDIAQLSSTKRKEVIYLPGHPENFSFFDEINN